MKFFKLLAEQFKNILFTRTSFAQTNVNNVIMLKIVVIFNFSYFRPTTTDILWLSIHSDGLSSRDISVFIHGSGTSIYQWEWSFMDWLKVRSITWYLNTIYLEEKSA